jgi:glycosyltransferase involved in cell wall biosynthesis
MPWKVLYLAHHFPPIGGAGVHRSLGNVQMLRAHGFDITVVTGAGAQLDGWSPEDRALVADVPSDVGVNRVVERVPGEPSPVRARARRWAAQPAPWTRRWVAGAEDLGMRAGDGADLIYASCVPYETAWVGARLSQRLAIPWIADLEDPWAFDEMRVHATALHRLIDFRRMSRALSTAAAIITCAEEAAARIRARLPGPPGRVVASVPIGFDAQAFAAAPAHETPGMLRIVHTGALHTELGLAHRRSEQWRRRLGGSSVGVDILTRSHAWLLDAVDMLLERRPELRGRLEVVLAGKLSGADAEVIGRRPYVKTPGVLSHRETVGVMRSADVLFLPMQAMPGGRRAGIVPYKTYEYLAARRPIVAAVPAGDARDILARRPNASVVDPADTLGIVRALDGWLQRAPVADVAPPADLDRRASVAAIAEVMRGVAGEEPRFSRAA